MSFAARAARPSARGRCRRARTRTSSVPATCRALGGAVRADAEAVDHDRDARRGRLGRHAASPDAHRCPRGARRRPRLSGSAHAATIRADADRFAGVPCYPWCPRPGGAVDGTKTSSRLPVMPSMMVTVLVPGAAPYLPARRSRPVRGGGAARLVGLGAADHGEVGWRHRPWLAAERLVHNHRPSREDDDEQAQDPDHRPRDDEREREPPPPRRPALTKGSAQIIRRHGKNPCESWGKLAPGFVNRSFTGVGGTRAPRIRCASLRECGLFPSPLWGGVGGGGSAIVRRWRHNLSLHHPPSPTKGRAIAYDQAIPSKKASSQPARLIFWRMDMAS